MLTSSDSTTSFLIRETRKRYAPDPAAMLSGDYELELCKDQDQEASELHDLAEAILLECKQARPISTLETSIFLLRQELDENPALPHLRVDTLQHLAKALVTRFDHTGWIEDLTEAFSLCLEVSQLSSNAQNQSFIPDNEMRSGTVQIALAALTEFVESVQISSLNTAIYLYGEAMALRPPNHPKSAISLCGTATAAFTLSQASGISNPRVFESLFQAVTTVLRLRPLSHPERYLWLTLFCVFLFLGPYPIAGEAGGLFAFVPLQDAWNEDKEAHDLCNRGHGMVETFIESGQMSDLDSAILLLRRSLALRPSPHPQRAQSLTYLAQAFCCRAERADRSDDLDTGISLYRETLELRPEPHPKHHNSLCNRLASALLSRFERTGQAGDLEEAIVLQRQALDLGDDKPNTLNTLGVALRTRFQNTGHPHDLEEAILLLRKVLEEVPMHADAHCNLGGALFCRFKLAGQASDLLEGTAHLQEALELMPSEDPLRSGVLSTLASLLLEAFRQTGQRNDLDNAMSFLRQSLAQPDMPYACQLVSYSNLAIGLTMQYRWTGQRDDLDDAITCYQKIFEIIPASHPDQCRILNNLAIIYSLRHEDTEQPYDIEQAITFYRQALELMCAPHPMRSNSLVNLASALRCRSGNTNCLQDTEEAIALLEEAAQIHPEFLSCFASLNGLGSALKQRFHQTGQRSDLDKAIMCVKDALKAMPSHSSDRYLLLFSLATSLAERFDETQDIFDLEEAVYVFREGLYLLPINHPGLVRSRDLAIALVRLHSVSGNNQHLEEAFIAFSAAVQCQLSSIQDRFRAAKHWAIQADSHRHPSALEAYQEAINLLPLFAAIEMDLKTRQDMLLRSDGLARNAAHFAICADKFETAVEFLEGGRGVFWSQALRLRNPFDDLQVIAPALAQTLLTISRKLEKGSLRDAPRRAHNSVGEALTIQQEMALYRTLKNDWQETLDKARKLNGFENLLRPKPFDMLRKVAANGHVVMLNASVHGCDGLILTLTGVKHISFPNLSFMEARALILVLRTALSPSGRQVDIPESIQTSLHSDRTGRLFKDPGLTSDDLFRYVLRRLWEDVVYPVVQVLGLQVSDRPPRLWWCPTGLFTLFPIHAAGIYDANTKVECISDYIISSYTPTLSLLLTLSPPPSAEFVMAAIIQPDILGRPELRLPATVHELRKIESWVPKANLVKIGTPENPTSVSKVLAVLPSVSIAHFCCHGMQNRTNPLESALILSDGELKVSTIMEHPLPHASLAFLSACETAMVDEKSPDENIHLAGSMLFAGFRGVVATMWTISDMDGPKVADAFYEHLFKATSNGRLDTTEAARALHLATKKLRNEEGCSFRRWVPFVHFGL